MTQDANDAPIAEPSSTGALKLTLTAVGVAGLMFSSLGYVLWLHKENITSWGALGDALGPLSGILAAGALGAAIASVLMQTKELALQRAEFTASRKAQQALASETKRSNDLAARAAFAQERANFIADTANAVALLQSRVTIALAATEYLGGYGPEALVAGPSVIPKTNDPSPERLEVLRELSGHAATASGLHALLIGGQRPDEEVQK